MMKLNPGQKFRMLTIESFNEYRKVGKANRGFYNCICECGNKCIVRDTALTRKNGKKSCGCYRKLTCKNAAQISSDKRWLGGNEAAKRQLISYYKSNAKRRNHIFTLTDEEFYKLTENNCFYCGKEPQSEQKRYRSKIDKIYESYIYNGIDQIEAGKGYTKENTVTACINCNRAKRKLTQEQFYDMIRKIYVFKNL